MNMIQTIVYLDLDLVADSCEMIINKLNDKYRIFQNQVVDMIEICAQFSDTLSY